MRYYFMLNLEEKRKVFIVFTIISLLFAIATIFLYGMQLYKKHTYDSVVSKVVDYDVSDSNNVWTEFEYEYDGKIYNVIRKGHSYYMTKNSEINLLVNTNNPEEIEVEKQTFAIPQTIYIMGGIVWTITALMGVNYLYHKNKEESSKKKK